LYLARIYVTLKATVNDPQGQTVLGSLRNLGFSAVADVRVGKYLEVRVDEADASRAEALITEMCQKLLANPVIEEFRFDLDEIAVEPSAISGQPNAEC
jgi:phosphoribosylformylglycinamidine synthase PurS subunit